MRGAALKLGQMASIQGVCLIFYFVSKSTNVVQFQGFVKLCQSLFLLFFYFLFFIFETGETESPLRPKRRTHGTFSSGVITETGKTHTPVPKETLNVLLSCLEKQDWDGVFQHEGERSKKNGLDFETMKVKTNEG